MTNRLTSLFQTRQKNILSVFYTAGFPALNDTVTIGKELEKAGADIIEIGIPFSDPVADGPTIQRSNKIALDNGMNVRLLLEQVTDLRKTCNLPVVLMGYLNPVMQYGVEKFVEDAHKAGVDGLIIPDLPAYEFEEKYRAHFDSFHICNTFLISPTTSVERINKIDELSSGFVYAVSASSTTGVRKGFADEQLDYFRRIGSMKLSNPILIGFGISDSETFKVACSFGAGAIVGSAFISMLENAKDISIEIPKFVKNLKS